MYAEVNTANSSSVTEEKKPIYKNKNLKSEQSPKQQNVVPVTPKVSLNTPVTPAPTQMSQVQQSKTETPPPPTPQPTSSPSVTVKKETPKKLVPKPEVVSTEKSELPPDAEQIDINNSVRDENIESNVSDEIENTNGITLPDVSFEEINAAETISQLTPDKNDGNNIVKTIISLTLVLTGVIVIVFVIFSNRRIPKSYEPNKFGRNSRSKNKKSTKRYYKRNYY